MSRHTKDFDYQLDLTPFISLLSVCICFLLLTVAWFQIGSLSVRQAIGSSTQEVQAKNPSSVWIYIKAQKKIEIRLKKGQKFLSQKFIEPSDSALQEFKKYMANLKKERPGLEEAFIFPQEQAVYEDIIKIMDSVRQAGIFSMGLSPI